MLPVPSDTAKAREVILQALYTVLCHELHDESVTDPLSRAVEAERFKDSVPSALTLQGLLDALTGGAWRVANTPLPCLYMTTARVYSTVSEVFSSGAPTVEDARACAALVHAAVERLERRVVGAPGEPTVALQLRSRAVSVFAHMAAAAPGERAAPPCGDVSVNTRPLTLVRLQMTAPPGRAAPRQTASWRTAASRGRCGVPRRRRRTARCGRRT